MRKLILCAVLILLSGVICVQAQYVDRTKITEAVALTATLQNAATANGNGSTLDVSGYSSVSFVVTGTFSATVNFEATGDDTNWVSLQIVQIGTTTISTTSTSTGTFSAGIGSLKTVRARISGYSSGSITVVARANLAQGANPQVVTANAGTNLNTSTLATSAKQSDGSQKTQVVDGSGNVIGATSNALDINIKSGNPTTITATQGTASNLHTAATLDSETTKVIGTVRVLGNSGSTVDAAIGAASAPTNQIVTGGVFNSTKPTLTNGQSAAIQLDSKGNHLAVIRDAAGNDRGMNVDASNRASVSVDNTPNVAVTSVPSNQSVNVAQVNGATVPTGNGTAAGAQRVAIASDNTAISVNNTQQGTASQNVAQINGVTPLMGNGTTGTGSPRVTIASDNTANSNPWLAQPVPGTANGASTCVLQSAASTNATNCKNAAGLLYGVEVINTTSTIYYLRLYNLSSSPTCSSATGFIRSIPIPHGSGAGAGIANFYTVGETYGTGIGFCLTGGGSSTDNSNAATGVYISLHYK